MAWTPGGSLISVQDLLEDLKHNDLSSIAEPDPDEAQTQSEASNLPSVFERTFKELNTALELPGYTWIGSTQRLSSGLAAANELVTMNHAKLEILQDEVVKLQKVVERGENVLSRLK